MDRETRDLFLTDAKRLDENLAVAFYFVPDVPDEPGKCAGRRRLVGNSQ
jgi:hypothetical protein